MHPQGTPHVGSLGHDLWRAAGVVLIATGICRAIEPWFDPANLIMVYMSGVVYVALRSRRVASLAAVAASIAVFDWIFVPPRWSFKPTDPQYYFTFVVMLIVGLLVSELAGRARLQAIVAEARARKTQALNALASALAMARSHDAIAEALDDAVRAALGLTSGLLVAEVGDALAVPAGEPWIDPASARRALQAPPGASPGRTDAALYFPLHSMGQAMGVLAVRRGPHALHPEQEALLTAFANQAALAVERSTYERQSAQAAVDAEAERLRSTLLSGLSHDFRTPMTTIMGCVTSLLEQDQALDADGRRALLSSVLGEARRMHGLTSGLLDLTRLEEGAVQPNCEWCPADELVGEVMQALEPRLPHLQVRLHTGADTVVWCDPLLVQQALVNLMDNAIRHTPHGGCIDVAVAVDGRHWQLAVADTGPGLPPGQEQQVFRKFYRPASDVHRDGAGLGLAICAAIARLHGGTIAGSSAGGARIVLTLPQPELADAPLDA